MLFLPSIDVQNLNDLDIKNSCLSLRAHHNKMTRTFHSRAQNQRFYAEEEKAKRSVHQNAKRTLTTPTQVCPRRARSRPTFELRVEEGMRKTKLTSRELETLTMNWQVGILYAFNFVLVLRWWKCKRRTRLRRPLTQSTGNCEAQVQELEPSTEVEGANSEPNSGEDDKLHQGRDMSIEVVTMHQGQCAILKSQAREDPTEAQAL